MACVFSHLVSTSSIVSALALPARGRDVTSNDGSDDAAFARGLSAASIFVPEGFDTFEAMMLLECSGNNMVVDRSAAHFVVKERGRTRMWSVLQVSSFAFATTSNLMLGGSFSNQTGTSTQRRRKIYRERRYV